MRPPYEPPNSWSMKNLAAFLLVLVVVIFVAAAAMGGHRSESAYKEERAAVADFDDCVALQARFDGWYDNRFDFDVGVASSSMDADDDRMDEIGCYG